MVNYVSSVTDSASGADAMKKSTGLNKDDFLKLFIAQMQNQDPLNPMDGTQFISQLAQLTQVEQAYNTNSNLQNLVNAQNGTNSLASVSFLGNTVVATGSKVGHLYGSQSTMGINLPTNAQTVKVDILDSLGNTVRSLDLGPTQQGIATFTWDGMGTSGQSLPSGTYSFTVKAATADGTEIPATTLVQGKVDGVSLDGASPVLSVGGVDVPLSDVISVKGA